jgi:hypothetical protein
VHGIFNTGTRQWIDHATVDSYRLGADLADLHRNRRMVIHTVV